MAVCASVSSLRSVPGRYITVAWDPSADAGVVGYAVYVGTAPGNYDKVFIVRNRTYFTYADAVPDRRYYFAVVAYTESLVSTPSQEVSGYGQSTPALPVSDGLAIQNSPSALAALKAARPLDGTTIIASTEGSIGALGAIGDGRVLIVEDGRRICVFDGHTVASNGALEASRSITFIGIAVDPRVEQRSRIYVAETERDGDGTRELRIVRYRELQNTLGEPAVIVAGIHLPETGDAPFTVDSYGRIFVAVPSFAADANSSVAVVLGFESDGSALRFNRAGSPIVSSAPSSPTGIAWDDQAEQLWLAGIDAVGSTVARVPVAPLTSSDAWPRVPQLANAVSPDVMSQRMSPARNSKPMPRMLLMTAPRGDLLRVLLDTDEFAVARSPQEETTATSIDPQTKSTYVAARLKFGAIGYIYKIDN